MIRRGEVGAESDVGIVAISVGVGTDGAVSVVGVDLGTVSFGATPDIVDNGVNFVSTGVGVDADVNAIAGDSVSTSAVDDDFGVDGGDDRDINDLDTCSEDTVSAVDPL